MNFRDALAVIRLADDFISGGTVNDYERTGGGKPVGRCAGNPKILAYLYAETKIGIVGAGKNTAVRIEKSLQ